MQLQDTTQVTQQSLQLLNAEESLILFGMQDEHLRMIRNKFASKITARGDTILITGDEAEVEKIVSVFEELLKLVRQGERISKRDIEYVLEFSPSERVEPLAQEYEPLTIALRNRKGMIKPKSPGQRKYINAIANNDIVFGVGPAGTGKTYLAVAAAVAALSRKEVRRIILCRPAVEAGESLGFLPGDLQAKVDPFLRPLYDALYDMLSPELVQRYIEQRVVEIAPLAYMRGRTLNNSFVIVDEAQNTTHEQMKMLLTRLGFESKAIITGDITQIDLPKGRKSGLIEAVELLSHIDGIEFIHLGKHDIVRHRLVQKIVEAYEEQTASEMKINGQPKENKSNSAESAKLGE